MWGEEGGEHKHHGKKKIKIDRTEMSWGYTLVGEWMNGWMDERGKRICGCAAYGILRIATAVLYFYRTEKTAGRQTDRRAGGRTRLY